MFEFMNSFDLIKVLDHRRVYIQTHNFPDPDAISSAFALQQFLAHYNIIATICYDGRIDRLNSKKMLDNFGITMFSSTEIPDMQPEDFIILVDSQKMNSNVTDFIGKEVACIDHHPTNIAYDYQYLDIQMVGACASIIASYFHKTNLPLSGEAAAALAYGIKVDTAEFTRGVTELDMQMFSFLFSYANWDLVKNMYSNTLEFEDLQAYGSVVQNIKIFGTTGFAHIPNNCEPALIAIISDFILALNVMDVAVIYALRDDGIRFSVRSERAEVHAGDLIKLALEGIGSGGGHTAMAGGFIPMDKIPLLGSNLHVGIHDRFLHAEKENLF